MKNLLPSLLPALALLTLGGCAGTSALSTTENDGVYYSSQDRTTQNATASVASAASTTEVESGDEISNPDYATNGHQSSTVNESTEYYDDDYAYSSRIRRFHQPYYRGFGYGYNDFVYADPFWYGNSPYYGSAFHDPFYGSGYGYGGLGSYVDINIGFGSPWGYNPWRYGRGYSLFDNYYGGYGGYGSYGYSGYGYGGYGNNNYYNVNNYYGGGLGSTRNVRYSARDSRSAEAGMAGRTSAGTGNVTGSRSRAINEGGIASPTGGRSSTGGFTDNGTVQPSGRGRSRSAEAGTLGGVPSEGNTGGRAAGTVTDQQVTGRAGRYSQNVNTGEQINNGSTISQPSYESRGRRRTAEAVGNVNDGSSQQSSQPQYSQPRRTRFSELNSNQTSSGQSFEQPVRRQRTYEAPQQRTYEQPTRSYEAPQRSYSEPSRSSSPSPSSSGGSNSGGSNSGGGGGRGRGRD